MEKRKQLILSTIIKEHIKTGAPVGSGVLVDRYKLDISPATVRNEMAELEDEGLITQPYTSAGRVPTEKAYNLFIEKLSEKKLKEDETRIFEKILRNKDELSFKQAAKEMAKISNNAVFWAFYRHNLYYTGVSNLLAQPEFVQTNLMYDISVIIDRLDEIIDGIYNDIKYETQILLGSGNPFGKFCGTILAKYKSGENTGVFGILGPIRMDYEKNSALVKFVYDKIISDK